MQDRSLFEALPMTLDENEDTPIEIALKQKHFEIVTILNKKTSYIQAQPSLLSWAMSQDDPEPIVRFLLENGANINTIYKGHTILQVAARKENLAVIALLIEKGVDVNLTHILSQTYGTTPLYMAATYGNLEMVKFLLNNGAEIDLRNFNSKSQGLTPLQGAVFHGRLEVVKFFIKEKAADWRVINYNQQTLLHIAINTIDNFKGRDHFEIIKFLIEEYLVDFNAVADDGNTPLMTAAINGNIDIVKLLLEKGTSIGKNFHKTKRPLPLLPEIKMLINEKIIADGINHYAALYFEEKNHQNLFIEKAMAIYTETYTKMRTAESNEDQEILFVSRAAYAEISTFLLTKITNGAELFLEIGEKLSEKYPVSADLILHDSKLFFEKAVLQLMQSFMSALEAAGNKSKAADADFDAEYFKTRACLHWEKNNFSPLTYKAMEAAEADEMFYRCYVNVGEIPFHAASREGNIAAIQNFLSNGTDIETKNEKGDTALHIAAKSGQVKVVSFLLDQGANKHALNKHGYTPINLIREYLAFNLNLALREQYSEIMNLFLRDDFQKENASIIKMAETCFADNNNQVSFVKKIKIHLENREQSISTACQTAYFEMARSLIEKRAEQLPKYQRNSFIKHAKKRSANYLKSKHNNAFEVDVIKAAYQDIRMEELNQLLDQAKQSEPAHYQPQFVDIAKENILKFPDWEHNKNLWGNEILNARTLIAEKRKLVHFLRNEADRIRNDKFNFLYDKTKTQNKLYKIEHSIQKLKGNKNQSGWISNFEELKTFKLALLNSKDFAQKRFSFFSNANPHQGSKSEICYLKRFGFPGI